MPAAPPRDRSGFDVLIICALPIEADAVEAIFDVYYEGVNDYGAAPDDPNSYATGAIGNHNVVLLRMPGMGSISSASTAANVRLSFPAIRLALVVGICGAVPHYQSKDIFLGDIIVSRLIVQYDFGRQYPTKFERKTAMEDSFGRPSVRIRSLLATLEGKRKQKMMTDLISTTLQEMQDEDSDYTWPGAATDLSFDASYYHKHRSTCEECLAEDSVGCSVSRSATCDKLACAEHASTQVRRRPEFDGLHRPAIHIGRMGCANTVMKSGHDRDRWATEDSLIGFEMEGAGVWDNYPSLVIKAVCDYADSHKNKAWQIYTTAVAAAAAKALLKEWRPPVETQADQIVAPKMRIAGCAHWLVQRPLNPIFTGRDEILKRIQDLLDLRLEGEGRYDPCRIVITGLGGMGKSEICLKVANHMRERFWAVFWVDVSSKEQAKTAFLDIAQRLKIIAQTASEVKRALENLRQPWLLVLDNADDVDFDYSEFLPSGRQGYILMTSRIAECSKYATSTGLHEELSELGKDDAKRLLLKAARADLNHRQAEDDEARQICELLGNHALAIIQAGSYVAQGYCTLRQYPALFAHRRKTLLQHHPDQAKSRYGDIFSTFEVVAEMLDASEEQDHRDALALLSMIAMLSHNPLPIQVFEAAKQTAVDESEELKYQGLIWQLRNLPDVLERPEPRLLSSGGIKQSARWLIGVKSTRKDSKAELPSSRVVGALSLLTSLALVTRSVVDNSVMVSMHPLVHAWARDRQNSKQIEKSWTQALCTMPFSSFATQFWTVQGLYLQPHLLAILDRDMKEMFAGRPRYATARLLSNLTSALLLLTMDAKCLDFLDKMFVYLGLKVRKPDLEHWAAYNNYSIALGHKGDDDTAVYILQKLYDGLRPGTFSKGQTQNTLQIACSLSTVYNATARPENTISLLEPLMSSLQNLPSHDIVRMHAETCLGEAYGQTGKTQEAAAMLKRAAQMQLEALGEAADLYGDTQRLLAFYMSDLGQRNEAISMLEQLRIVQEKHRPVLHARRLLVEAELGRQYLKAGRTAEAIRILEVVEPLQAKIHRSNDPSLLETRLDLGEAYLRVEECSKTVDILEPVMLALSQPQRVRVPSSRTVCALRLSKGYLFTSQADKAVSILQGELSVLPEDSSWRTSAMELLITAFQQTTQLDQEIKTRETYQEHQLRFSIHPSHAVRMRHDLGKAYARAGRHGDAIRSQEEAVATAKAQLPEEDPIRLTAQYELARQLLTADRAQEARDLTGNVVGVLQKHRAETDLFRLACEHQLAYACFMVGDKPEAMETMQKVVDTQAKALSEDHSQRILSEKTLTWFKEST